MLFFDVFFDTVYLKKRKDKDSALFSACAIMSAWIGFSIGMIVHIIGLIKDNPASRWALDNVFLVFAPIGLVCYIGFLIRYERLIGIENLKKRMTQQSAKKLKIFKFAVYFFLIAVPIGSYVFFRLYMFGHV